MISQDYIKVSVTSVNTYFIGQSILASHPRMMYIEHICLTYFNLRLESRCFPELVQFVYDHGKTNQCYSRLQPS